MVSEPSLGLRIKEVRNNLGLSQVEFAQFLGVTNVSVNRWEHDKSIPHPATLDRIFTANSSGHTAVPESPTPSVSIPNLIGRTAEFASIVAALKPGEIVTLVGPAGIGKSALARSISATLSLPVFWVDLSSIDHNNAVIPAIARVLGIRSTSDTPDVIAVSRVIQTRPMLIVLDTCEHVLAGCCQAIADLGIANSSSRLLATSRTAITVQDEQVIQINSLDSTAARELFVTRAQSLSPDDLTLVPDLCHRLDGIPLAVELAAARTAILTIGQILERMDRQFDMIEPMAAAIAWSCNLLNPDEAELFRTLGIFHGSFDLSAVEAIHPKPGVITLLQQLVAQSMVQAERTESDIRYRLLDSLAAYARTWLAGEGDLPRISTRHAYYFAKLTIDAAVEFRSADQVRHLKLVDDAWPNLGPALAFLIAAGNQQTAADLATAISRHTRRRSSVADGLQAVNAVLYAFSDAADPGLAGVRTERALLRTVSGDLDDAYSELQSVLTIAQDQGDRARALDALGLVYRGRSDRPAALTAHAKAFDLFQNVGDRHGAASSRLNLALIANVTGDLDMAMHGCHEAWSLLRGLDDIWGEATILANLGEIAGRQEKPIEAAGYFERAMERYRQFGDPEREAVIAANTAEIRMTLGEYAHAERLITPAVAHFRSTGNRIQLANALYVEGAIQAALGPQRHALEIFRESLNLFHTLDDIMDVAYVLETIVRIQIERGDIDIAMRLWGGMEAIRERERVPEYPLLDYTGTSAMIRAESANEALAAELINGATLPLPTLIGEATLLGVVTDGPPTLVFRLISAAPRSRLERYVPTERQIEVLRLVAVGKTNSQIARVLAISPRTVERHLSTMFGNLGVDRRSAAVAVAAARGLL